MKRINPVMLNLIGAVLVACSAATVSAGQTVSASGVRGRVVDPFGDPIHRATLELSSPGRARPFRVETDRRGDYEFKSLPAGEYVAVITSPGFVIERRTLILGEATDYLLDVGMVAGHLTDPFYILVTGAVLKRDKAPLAGALVTVEHAFNRRLVYQVRADPAGRYRIAVPDPGQYIISASAPGYMVSVSAVVLPATLPRQDKVINLTLSPLRAVE